MHSSHQLSHSSRQEFNDKSCLFQPDTNDQLPVDESGPGDFNLFETEGGDKEEKEPDKVCIVIAFADLTAFQLIFCLIKLEAPIQLLEISRLTPKKERLGPRMRMKSTEARGLARMWRSLPRFALRVKLLMRVFFKKTNPI